MFTPTYPEERERERGRRREEEMMNKTSAFKDELEEQMLSVTLI